MIAQEQQSCSCSSQPEKSTSTLPCFDLIMLARFVGRQLFNKEIEVATVATRLLQHLLHVTASQKGALLFPEQTSLLGEGTNPVSQYFPAVPRSSSGEEERWYLLASQGISIEDVAQTIARHSPNVLNQQPPSGIVECTFYHLPIAVPSQAVPAELTFEQEATYSDEAEAHIRSPHLPSHIEFLLLQEDFVPEEESESSGIKSTLPASLPLCIQEAAGTVLMMMFLALVGAPSPVPSPVRRQEKELLQAELLATLNHELRSPLAAIKGSVEILLRHEQRIQPEERHEFLLAIDDASTRLTKRIHDLLELSQLETGTALFEFSSVNVAVLARESFLAAKLRWEQENTSSSHEGNFSLSLEDEYGSPTLDEPVIQADRQRLREMLDHLLHNALQYSPQGGEIDVLLRPILLSELRAMKEENGQFRYNLPEGATVPPMLEIRVRDHGIGIPHRHQQSIFDGFRQVDMSLTREVNGLGLGLSICKHIVEMHKGSIWVASEVGKGSTFHIWLPNRKAV